MDRRWLSNCSMYVWAVLSCGNGFGVETVAALANPWYIFSIDESMPAHSSWPVAKFLAANAGARSLLDQSCWKGG